MRLPHFNEAFPTLFKPMVVPNGPCDNENDDVLACFRSFLAVSEDETAKWLFPTEKTLLQEGPVEGGSYPELTCVLKSMRALAESFCDLHGGEATVQNGIRSKDGLTPTLIHQSLKRLELGGYWGMWVPSQNGVLLVHRAVGSSDEQEIACVYAWEAQARNADVMGPNESIQQSCPRSATSVPWDRFQGYPVAECLWELAAKETAEKAVPKSHKAGQIFDENRDVVNPMYLTEYFLAPFGGDAIPTSTISGVHKKMKDHVVYSGGELPWRRAPLWAALKSLLHVVCVMETTKVMKKDTNVAGEAIYKVLIQNFLSFCLDNSDEISVSAKVEGARKIVRRRKKVESISDNPWKEHPFFQASMNICAMMVRNKMEACERDWKEKCDGPVTFAVDLDKIRPEKDITHQLSSSRPILTKLIELKENFYRLENERQIPEPVCRKFFTGRDVDCQLLLEYKVEIEQAFENWEREPQDIVGHLFDAATSIYKFFMDIRDKKRRLGLDEANLLVRPLMELLDSYSRVGLELYRADPRGCGEVVIVTLSMVVIVDMLACLHFPILEGHKLDIDPEFLHYVFAPTMASKKMLCELEQYIKGRNRSTYPSSIEAGRSKSSLSVRFASQDAGMLATLEMIQKRCQSNQQAKTMEFEQKKNKYDELQNQIRRKGSCSCYSYDSNGYSTGKVECHKCTLVVEAHRIKLGFYEKLLPPKKTQQLAVVFELKQPDLLVAQRNAILFLHEKICNEKWHDTTHRYLWSGEGRLDKWSDIRTTPLDMCELGSTRKKLSQSHYNYPRHVTDHGSFIVDHDYETVLMGRDGMAKPKITWNIKAILYSIELKSASRYKNLEEFFNSFSHNENEIIASKSKASEEISLVEFEKVGTLRAGPSHQLIRLSSCLAQGAIDLKREEMVSLISSVLWQAGPPSSLNEVLSSLDRNGIYEYNSCWHRQQSEILQIQDFVADLCGHLNTTLDGCSSNWANSNILLNVTNIAMHVNEHVLNCCAPDLVSIVKKCRGIAVEWIGNLTDAFNLAKKDNEKQELRSRIAFVAATGSLTFADSDALLSKENNDVGQWVFFRATFNSNVAPAEMKEQSNNKKLFLHAYAVAESIEPRLLHLLGKSDKSDLTTFLETYWSPLKTGELNWMQHKARRWFRVNCEGCIVQIEIITGDVLVNGVPPKSLPRSITSHEIFCRIFGKATFMVKPIGNQGYRTSSKVNGFFYEFYAPLEARFNEAPIIVQESEGLRAILVPWYFFKGDFPENLVDFYSHWFITTSPSLQISKGFIYFRPRSHKMAIPSSEIDIHHHFSATSSFKLDCHLRTVSEMRTKNYFIDIRSVTSIELFSKVFSRLSPERKIHVSFSLDVEDKIQIKIPVMQNIGFTFDRNTGRIRSIDFRGLKVSKDQNFGSLIGMKHGLLLEGNSDSENRIFLCPHGEVKRLNDESVLIDIERLRSPPLFRFEIRPELRDLRSCTQERIASLFLANLHASSSGVLADPFTRTTGTQRALTILRSGHCSGNLINCLEEEEIKESLSNEARVLCEIASISYWRKDYHFMEMNDTSLSTFDALCANSAFAFLAKIRLDDLEDSLKAIGKNHDVLEYFSDSETQRQIIAQRTSHLSRRAYIQNREMYAKDSILNHEEEKQIFGSRISNDASLLPLNTGFDFDTIRLAHILGFEIHNGCFNQINKYSLFDLLCSMDVVTLQGITNQATLCGAPVESFQSLFGLEASVKLNFRDIWLNLYHVCRTKINADSDMKTSLSFLMAWVLTEFPDKNVFLQQLSVVANYPNLFPSTDDISDEYNLPHEKDYCHGDVHKVIDSHLKHFNEREPERGREKMQWRQRRDDHNAIRRNEMDRLGDEIRSNWHNDFHSIQVSMSTLLLDSGRERSLLNEIKDLFERWRKAERLHRFINKVMTTLGEIHVNKYGSLVALGHDQADHVVSLRRSFELPTGPRCIEQEVQSDLKQVLKGIKPYTFNLNSLHTLPDVKNPDQLNLLSFLEKSSFLKRHPEYQKVWDALVEPLRESWFLACNVEDDSIETLESHRSEIELQLKSYAQRAERAYSKCYEDVTDLYRQERGENVTIQLQNQVGLMNSIGPYDLILQCLGDSTGKCMKQKLLLFAIAIKHFQRARRCLRLHIGETSSGLRKHFLSDLSIRFLDSLDSFPGLNEFWSAVDHPEFLLFEIDNDIGIRDTQAEVAFEILKNDIVKNTGTKNRLMQLNMGEGKTAVIMPLVLASAARGDKLVRATVLSSLYRTNTSDWQYKLGGLLNRHIYPMICRRDIPIGIDEANHMLQRCEAIRENKHAIVTVPEHRLSLENKALELASNLSTSADLEASKCLHKVIACLWENAREFLDESDEILSPKYQLIYTIGPPCDMEGSHLRWEIHACIYESINRHASSLLKAFGPDTIELGKLASPGRKTEYVGVRLLEGSPGCDDAYNAIKKNVIDDILSSQTNLNIRLRREEMTKWKNCVEGKGNGHDIDGLPTSARVLALCLRGMLDHNVLKIVLFKRWRVQYGNHPTRKRFNMAVPYRAKDVAAERTEYGHPDVALSLTFSHYYQAGLKEGQLRDVFEKLQRMRESDAKAEYSSWVEDASEEMEGIRSYDGVNIDDTVLFANTLFPIFRKNMRVIRFWLVSMILPVQAKQFPFKLLSTAPELCRSPQLGSHWAAVTTGFSGTDDLSLLLPPTIVQENIESLQQTNGIQLRNLLREENNQYFHLVVDDDATSEIIHRTLKTTQEKSCINVVLDAGALLLQKSNSAFVKAWLQKRPDMEAGAFFEGSTIFVLRKDGMLMKFKSSPYCTDMSKCLLYLDDIHTRGSDFRLPLTTRAILTLGKGMEKDKFLQACMRMRQLGHGQSILFVASREVNRVLETDFAMAKRHCQLGCVSAILEWTISNSVKRICDLMPYFASQMRTTFLKSMAYNKFYKHGDSCLKSLVEACVEDEILELMQLYGHERGDDFLPNIIDRRLSDCLSGDIHAQHLVELVSEVRQRIRRLAPDLRLPCSMFDEEQERELEQELEEEIDIERPPPAKPLKPQFSQNLLRVLKLGMSRPEAFPELCKNHLKPLSNIFRETSFGVSPIGMQLVETDNVFVTKDFVNTIKGEAEKDWYIKNICWYLRWGFPRNMSFVVISNFEAEKLSNLLSSKIQQKRDHFPSLYAFAPITRQHQRSDFLPPSSCEPPFIVHVFAGSVHADEIVVKKIRNYLSVFPRPTSQTGMLSWDALFDEGSIHRDGFVPPEHRGRVDAESSKDDFDGTIISPFRQSPVKPLTKFLVDSRHLGSALPTSSVGKLLGASKFVSHSEDES